MLELQPGARCVLLESHPREHAAGLVQNLQVHVRLADGASLQHLRVALPATGDRLAHHVHVRLQRDASYAQCLLASTSDYHLQRNQFELEGEGAARMPRRAAGRGRRLGQVLARHAAARSRSTVELLALPGAAARMVASAHAHRRRQRRRAGTPAPLRHPRGRPAAHRAETAPGDPPRPGAGGAQRHLGLLPEEALFHARQRGLDEAAAKSLILSGLARSVLARAIDDEPLPPALRLDAALEAALARALAAAPLAVKALHG